MEERQVLPLEAIVSYINNKSKVLLTLNHTKLECNIVGVDEYLNLVVDTKEERMLVKSSFICMVSLVE